MNEPTYFGEWWSIGWSAVLNHLWQSTVFAVFAFLAILFLRRAPARVRHAIWLIASFKFILPSSFLSFLARESGIRVSSLFVSVANATGDPEAALGTQHQLFHIAGSANNAFSYAWGIFLALGIVWLAGASVSLWIWRKRQRQFSSDLESGVCLKEGREFEILQRIKRKLSITNHVALMVCKSVTEPGVWGIRKPVIVFPENMTAELQDAELEAVLIHELAHVSRKDNLFSYVQKVISSLFWFYPVIWWIDRQLLAERERACDDRVIEAGGRSRVYAAGLLKVLKFGLGFRMAGVSCASGSNLKKRIDHIINQDRIGGSAFLYRLTTVVAASILIVYSVIAIDIGDCERDKLREKWDISHQQNPFPTVKPTSASEVPAQCPSEKRAASGWS